MSTSLKDKITTLIDAIDNRPPFCGGIRSLPVDSFGLFFKKHQTPDWIDLSNASQPQLEQLSQACYPATFGLGQQDVHDETYRKAGKLDLSDFATKFSLECSGLMDTVRSELLEGHDERKQIKAELYKLNMYGEGSFFKSHKDTPRGEKMFGSLVVTFPTPHEGGALILRHNGKEWTFDTAKALSGKSSPLIAYIAFYSDVEHEVTMVTSGHRVTLTYNLYFVEKNKTTQIDPSPLSNEVVFKGALSHLLLDPEFLPKGGKLGFGLLHQYPIPKSGKIGKLIDCLKGSDAVIRRVCNDLSLNASLKVMYDVDDDCYEDKCLIMVDEVVNLTFSPMDTPLEDVLCSWYGGTVVKPLGSPAEEDIEFEAICWVRPVTTFTRARTPFVAYGNEAELGYLYGDICLVVNIGETGKRETIGDK